MHRSKLVQFVGCLTLIWAGWMSGDPVQAETFQSKHLVVTQLDTTKLDGSKLLANTTVLASLEAKTSSTIETLQSNVSTPPSKEQRMIDDIKDSPLSSSRLLPDIGAFR